MTFQDKLHLVERDAASASSEPGQVVLVLQGGGRRLGSYQAGVYQALHEAAIEPDWIIGTSIGAINASLIAGNSPQKPACRGLREILEEDGSRTRSGIFATSFRASNEKTVLLVDGDQRHSRLLQAQSAGPCRRQLIPLWRRSGPAIIRTTAAGADADRTGGFRPRQFAARPRLTVGAAHVRSSQMRYFRQPRYRTSASGHIMASGRAGRRHFRRCASTAKLYWDGGILSNTPTEGRVRRQSAQELADLCRAFCGIRPGAEPTTMAEVLNRHKGRAVFQAGSPATSRASSRRIGCVMSSTSLPRGLPEAERQQRSGARNWQAMAVRRGCTWCDCWRRSSTARTTPRISTSARPASCSAGTQVTATTQAVLGRAKPWIGEFDPLSGVILHEQMEVMPEAAE